MKEKKNIDRIFQENLKDFEVFPPSKAWSALENRLEATTSKKRHIPIWIKISSIAALFILFFSVGTIYFLPTSEITKNIPFFDKKQVENSDKKDSIINKSITTTPNITDKNSTNPSIKINIEDNFANTNISADEDNSSLEDSSVKNKAQNNYYLTDAVNLPLPNNTTDKVVKTSINAGKFTVATIFAPIYINSLGNGSGIDSQFKENSTSGNSSYSYGVKIAYKLNNKFSVQSGVNLISLGYTTNNIYVTPGIAVLGFSNLSSTPISVNSKTSSFLNTNNSENIKSSSSTGSINQVFGYVEIPIEIKYNVVQGKFDLNLVGGFSTLLLNRDEVFVETNNFTQSLGSSHNLRSINFSGNIGLDVDYSIHKNLYINISPMFKVQTNTFSKNSGSLQPYYLGVYTGLNYKF